MLIVIHNLPFHFRYTDVKTLINDKCGLTEMIVDNLVEEGNSKKVTVGLADEGDAAILMRKINGLFVDNQQLYVENVRQKKTTEQPYRPSMDFYSGKASNSNPQPPIEQPYYMQQNAMTMPLQPPPFMMMDPSFMVAPNFNVPYYMSTPNVVENNQKLMVQYPMQGPPDNERYDAISRDQGDRELDGSRSPDRGPAWERSPRRQIKWSEPARGRSDDRRGRDRSPQRRDRPDAERSFTDKSYRGPFDSRINQYSEPKQSRFEKSSARSDSRWETDNSFQSNDNRSNDLYGRRPAHDRSQSYREDQYSKSRDPEYASRRDVSSNKKRPHDLPDNRFSPKSKKFGNNHEFNSRKQSETSGGAYQKITSKKFHNKPADLRPNMPHAHQNRPQSNREQVIPNRPLLPTPKAYQPKRQNETTPEFSKKTPIRPEEITPEIIARQESWRVHAAAVIANRINNQVARPRNKKDPVLMQLKACVRARLDVILGEDQTIILRDMISLYKEKFEDDKQFYVAVLEKVDKAIIPERKMTGKDTFGKMNTGLKSNTVPSKTQKRTQLAPNEVPDCSKELPTHVDPSVERLPKYPANKKIMTQMKKTQKEEMENEILYKLDDFREKVLSDELDKIEELFVEELGTPENEVEKTLSNFMINVLKPDLRKILTLLIKKRILNIRTNLTLRLNCQPKAPKREQLDQFLKNYGVLSLKKSDKHNHVFIAVCDSFKSYDTLCELGRTCIGESSVTFKPLHITGPPAKGKLKRPPIKVVTNYGNDMNSNNEQNMKIDATKDTKITTADSTIEHLDSDCEVLPHKDQVIVIEDSDTQLKDYIVIDEVTDQGKGDENVLDKEQPSETVETSQCERAIDVEPIQESEPTIDACENIDASDVNKDTIDNPAETHADKVAVDDSQATAINEQDVNETEEFGVLENIAEDDLEDF